NTIEWREVRALPQINGETEAQPLLRPCVLMLLYVRSSLRDGAKRLGVHRFVIGIMVPAIVRLCRQIYDEKRHAVKPPASSSTRHKGYLIELLTDDDLVRYPQLVDFCLSRGVTEAVTRYLGTLPVLRRVGLWLSFAAPMDGASRLFHLDPEDFTQVRMFLNVIDIRREQGPLTFLPADVSDTALARLWRDDRKNRARKSELRRWTDEEILTRAGMSPCI